MPKVPFPSALGCHRLTKSLSNHPSFAPPLHCLHKRLGVAEEFKVVERENGVRVQLLDRITPLRCTLI
jgi:hypothetical protein